MLPRANWRPYACGLVLAMVLATSAAHGGTLDRVSWRQEEGITTVTLWLSAPLAEDDYLVYEPRSPQLRDVVLFRFSKSDDLPSRVVIESGGVVQMRLARRGDVEPEELNITFDLRIATELESVEVVESRLILRFAYY